MTTHNVLQFFTQQKKVAAILIVTILMWSIGLPLLLNSANAAGVVSFSDTLSDSDLGVVSNHTIAFTTSNTGQLLGGESLTITFESDFAVPALLDYTDVDLKVGAAEQTLGATPSAGVWGVSTSTLSITFTSSDTTIGTSTAVEVQIGTNATSVATGDQQIINGTTEKSYTINVALGSGGTADSGTSRVAIINDVNMTASVDTVFTFNIYASMRRVHLLMDRRCP